MSFDTWFYITVLLNWFLLQVTQILTAQAQQYDTLVNIIDYDDQDNLENE